VVALAGRRRAGSDSGRDAGRRRAAGAAGAGPGAARLADGDVALVAHGHVLRILTACWLGLPPEDGALFALPAGRVGVLGFDHERPALVAWALR
jgi:broad specificity phosphatase PhoE